MKKRALLAAVLFLLAAAAFGILRGVRSYRQREGMRFVRQLGFGINLGNSLDAHSAGVYLNEPTVEDYETFWHNPPISATLLRAVKKAGFTTVRIPVSWGNHMSEKGKVDPLWMDRVEEVVREALDTGLTVILDTHHEAWLDLAEADGAEDLFVCLWEQIARRFSDCGENLLFEGWNEPRLRGSDLEWTEGNRKLRDRVNRMNRLFVETVREAGENNSKRWLLIPTYCNRIHKDAMEELVVPDRRCIVSLHLYITNEFCRLTNGAFHWDTEGKDAQKLLAAFDSIRECFTAKDIPVIITECGCIDKDNEADRILWVNTLRAGAERCGAACVWWDNGSEYRLLDRKTGEAVFPRLLRAFVGNGKG